MSLVRKISIGKDYKNDAMHYSVGQQVYGGHEIAYILFEDASSLSFIGPDFLGNLPEKGA